jgi:hypothetical protein
LVFFPIESSGPIKRPLNVISSIVYDGTLEDELSRNRIVEEDTFAVT